MLFNAFVLAFRAISRNIMRSFLTTLGIVIGIASVIILVTIGNGATQSVTGSIEKLGSNMLTLMPGQRARGPGQGNTASLFTSEDVRVLKHELSNIKAVAPQAARSVTAVYGANNHVTQLYGTDNDYFIAKDWGIEKGRAFTPAELQSGKASCIVGTTIEKELFGAQDSLGASIRLGKLSCQIIGVLASKGASGFGQDQDDIVLVPIRTFQRRISGSIDISSILISSNDGVDSTTVIEQVSTIMRERRHIGEGEEDDFSVFDLKEIINTVSQTTRILTLLLGAVAAISLLVGGIGIMNIMLVSVTERTREIGIRLAIGALEREVLMQFLVESIVLSMLGGVIGIILGLLGAWAGTVAFEIPFVMEANVILLAFGFSTMVGIVFGYFPARKAAQLDPIDALRHE
ncbi:MAG: multidrug ABC transporter substrate-binding protein [Sulfuricurvum sp. PC08-66]|nr:MAG: multidrug ABC transporter substrate-binding protein [Sulfuricurvum sp. PC08-66]